MAKKSLLLAMAILGIATIGLADKIGVDEARSRFQAPQSELTIGSPESGATLAQENGNLDSAFEAEHVSESIQLAEMGQNESSTTQLPSYWFRGSAQPDELGFYPRPCWCCKYCCCMW